MTASTQKIAPGALETAGLRNPPRELAVAFLFGPLADVLVRFLRPLRVSPPAVVLVHTALGLAAAYLLAAGELVAAALLLQLKTLLDNVDGRLARASGRADLLGRYLDTEADFVVNLALFAALASVTAEPLLALAGFVALALVLSVDFNVAGRDHDQAAELPAAPDSRVERMLARGYALVFAPQDRLVRGLSRRRLQRILAGETDARRREAARSAYHDRTTVAVLANLGLSTQLLVLGLLLVAAVPEAYLWLVVASLALLPVLQLRRERLARRALAR